MKKIYQYIIIFLTFAIITSLYSIYIFGPDPDEIWNFGFAYNILNGLIPYKDFNMIIPPLFAFTTVPIIATFGQKIIIFDIYTGMIIGLIMTLMYKKINKKAFLLYPILILGYLPSYNLFSILLFTILIIINDTDSKNKDIYLGIIASLMFLTKQTIGATILIPCLYYSKNKIKTIISFLIPNLIFLIYLIFNNALFNFIDYCFLGMASFGKYNGFLTINTIIIILFCLFFVYKLIKTKFKNSSYFYGLMFQIIAFPMGDKLHFFMALLIIFYVLLINYKLKKTTYIYLIIFSYITFFLILTIKNINNNNYIEKENDIYYGKNLKQNVKQYMTNYKKALEIANNIGYEEIIVLSNSAYFLKLSQHQTITKFDLINNGNMGYKGYKGYIQDIEEKCNKKDCLFITENYEAKSKTNQTNKQLMEYPSKNYNLVYVIDNFYIYKGKNK